MEFNAPVKIISLISSYDGKPGVPLKKHRPLAYELRNFHTQVKHGKVIIVWESVSVRLLKPVVFFRHSSTIPELTKCRGWQTI